MNIFVIGSGRCGTLTFSKSISHCTNYTVGHESHAGSVDRLNYPENHIEVSSHLTLYWPMLRKRYPQCRFVWIQRVDDVRCARSISKLQGGQIVRDFCNVFHQQPNPVLIEGALDIYDMMNAQGEASGAFRIEMENAKAQWQRCWDFMGCEGDFELSLNEWDTRYNETRTK